MEKVYETGVSGLICFQCEDILINDLLYVRGIISVKCSYFKGRVKITYDSDIISEELIKEKLIGFGFQPSVKNGKGKLLDLLSIVLVIGLFFLIRYVNLPNIPKADNDTSYLMLFFIGLVTGTHCIIMCGGIMLSQTSDRSIKHSKPTKNRIFSVIIYNLGRVITATILGIIFGAIGKYIVFSLKTKSILYTFTGFYIVFIALAMWGVPFLRKIQTGIPSLCEIKKKNKFLIQAGPFIAGIFTALLPCASSNSMWLLSVTSGDWLKGMLTMLSWSCGTVPFMMLFGLLSSFFNGRKQAWMIRINIILLITLGLNLAVNGISMMF